jgi:hypothetical protein
MKELLEIVREYLFGHCGKSALKIAPDPLVPLPWQSQP